jgi:Lon protease-like protein
MSGKPGAMRDTRIPLFPLNVVLLPGGSLPLHIFEPRYRLMVRHCIGHKLEFGMILAQETNLATVGCTTQIISVLREYPSGEFDILTEGRAVFRALDLLSEKEYHEAIVEYLSDSAEDAESSKEDSLMGMFQQCHSLMYNELWAPGAKAALWPLSYRMATRLPFALEERQSLLEMRGEPARQDFLRLWLSRALRQLERHNRARPNAGANGHSLN